MITDLRTRVLAASVQLIAEAGLAGLSMREVARRAGVSHQAPYHYFGDKAAIVAALVEAGFTKLADRMEAAAQAGGTPDDRLEGVGQAYVTFALEEPVYFRLMFRPELTDLARFPAAEAAGDRAFSVLEALVGETARPDARVEEREALVTLHWSIAHGLATLLLDGSLAEHLSDPAARTGHAEQVLRLFRDTMRRAAAR